MIQYVTTAEGLRPDQLRGFFEGWASAPLPETHLRLLEGSDEVVLAIDPETQQVVGFVTAITDSVRAASIPFLEVLPDYRRSGIAKELVRRMLDRLRGLYMIDLVCDPDLRRFYEPLGFQPAQAMVIRDYPRQSGELDGDG